MSMKNANLNHIKLCNPIFFHRQRKQYSILLDQHFLRPTLLEIAKWQEI